MTDKKVTTENKVFVVNDNIKGETQKIKQEKVTDRPKPVIPPPKKKS